MNDPVDFTPGRPTQIAPGVIRIVAPNASAMTGPGTNTFVLGSPPSAVLDPGPADPAHLRAILEVVPAPAQIFVTHTHRDHSPLAAPLAQRTGATRVGRAPPDDGRQDTSFVADQEPASDQCFAVGALALRAIHTPGHASNHVCWLFESAQLLFSGDHILDGVTPVILHPDGDMAAYLESLSRLRRYPLRSIAPGHGRVLANPVAVIDGILAHRARRERVVMEALSRTPGSTLDELLPSAYFDVGPAIWSMARLSLEANLVKLEREGRVRRDVQQWYVAES